MADRVDEADRMALVEQMVWLKRERDKARTELAKEYAARGQDIRALNDKVEHWKGLAHEETQKRSALGVEVARLTAEVERLLAVAAAHTQDELARQLAETRRRCDALDDTAAGAQAARDEARVEVARLSAAFDKAHDRELVLEAEVAHLTEALTKSQELALERGGEIADLREALEAAERRLREAGTSIHDTRTFPALSAHAAELHAKLEAAEARVRELEEVADRNATDCQHLRQTAIAYESELAQLRARVVKALTALEAWHAALEALRDGQ